MDMERSPTFTSDNAVPQSTSDNGVPQSADGSLLPIPQPPSSPSGQSHLLEQQEAAGEPPSASGQPHLQEQQEAAGELREGVSDDDDDDDVLENFWMLMDVFTEDFHPALDAAVASLEKRVFHPTAEPGCDGDDIRACAICLEDYEDGVEIVVTPCPGRHEFHPRCIANWLRRINTCPLCRHAL